MLSLKPLLTFAGTGTGTLGDKGMLSMYNTYQDNLLLAGDGFRFGELVEASSGLEDQRVLQHEVLDRDPTIDFQDLARTLQSIEGH